MDADMEVRETTNWTEELLAVLDRQQTLADQLAALAGQQQQLIDGQETDALLNLLAQRQQLVNDFLTTQNRFAELTADLDQRLDTLAGEKRDNVRSRIDRISALLADVMQTDAQDQKRLESARSDVVDDLEKVGANRQANTAYRVQAGSAPRYTDRKG